VSRERKEGRKTKGRKSFLAARRSKLFSRAEKGERPDLLQEGGETTALKKGKNGDFFVPRLPEGGTPNFFSRGGMRRVHAANWKKKRKKERERGKHFRQHARRSGEKGKKEASVGPRYAGGGKGEKKEKKEESLPQTCIGKKKAARVDFRRGPWNGTKKKRKGKGGGKGGRKKRASAAILLPEPRRGKR